VSATNEFIEVLAAGSSDWGLLDALPRPLVAQVLLTTLNYRAGHLSERLQSVARKSRVAIIFSRHHYWTPNAAR
jgi:hypothetical protein